MPKFKERLQWLWPSLVPLTSEEQVEDDEWARQLASSVQASNWSKDSEVVLEESRRLFDAEVDRRKGADAKAGIYLAAITALIPVGLNWTAALNFEMLEEMAAQPEDDTEFKYDAYKRANALLTEIFNEDRAHPIDAGPGKVSFPRSESDS